MKREKNKFSKLDRGEKFIFINGIILLISMALVLITHNKIIGVIGAFSGSVLISYVILWYIPKLSQEVEKNEKRK